MISVGDKFKAVRKALQMTQAEMGRVLSIQTSYVSLIETGKREPSDRTVKDLREKLRIRDEWWHTGEGSVQDSSPKNHSRPQRFYVEMVNAMDKESQNFVLKLLMKELKKRGSPHDK